MPSCAAQNVDDSASAFVKAASASLNRPAAISASPSESCGFGSSGMTFAYCWKAAIAPSASPWFSAA